MTAWSVPGVSGLDRRLRSEGRSAVPVGPARARSPRRGPRCRGRLGTGEGSRRHRGGHPLARSRLDVSMVISGHPTPSSHGRLTRARRFDRFPRAQAQSSPPSCPPLQLHGRPGRPAWRRRFAAARTDRSAARRIHPRARASTCASARFSCAPTPLIVHVHTRALTPPMRPAARRYVMSPAPSSVISDDRGAAVVQPTRPRR